MLPKHLLIMCLIFYVVSCRHFYCDVMVKPSSRHVLNTIASNTWHRIKITLNFLYGNYRIWKYLDNQECMQYANCDNQMRVKQADPYLWRQKVLMTVLFGLIPSSSLKIVRGFRSFKFLIRNFITQVLLQMQINKYYYRDNSIFISGMYCSSAALLNQMIK